MNWYVLHVRTGKETDVKTELNRLGHSAAAPSELRMERKGGRWHEQLKLLFPGYVFVQLKLTDANFYAVRDTPGVIRFLGAGRPEPLPEAEAMYIDWLANDDNPLVPSGAEFAVGGQVRITSGPLRGHEGNIIRINKRQRRAVLAITIGGCRREFSLSITMLEDG